VRGFLKAIGKEEAARYFTLLRIAVAPHSKGKVVSDMFKEFGKMMR
jgi:hypothetical protein